MKHTASGIFGNTESSAINISGSFKDGCLCELFLNKYSQIWFMALYWIPRRKLKKLELLTN